MTRNEGQASVILDNVCKLIQKKVHADNVLLVEKFAKALYSNMSKEDLAHRNDSDLYGAALSLWNSLEKNNSDDAVVRVFNTEVAKDGWQSSHTIVEIIAKDMHTLSPLVSYCADVWLAHANAFDVPMVCSDIDLEPIGSKQFDDVPEAPNPCPVADARMHSAGAHHGTVHCLVDCADNNAE